ncbi:TonB-dependent siderophore receptor [Pigmentiphaga soli]|uniref:TonB-dependent siderophore receptor n=1 Tax=Pigmentiphaga soli TaxID=1007095 RepID=A0ABP8HF48_9BURK
MAIASRSSAPLCLASSLAFAMLGPVYAQPQAGYDFDLPAGPLGESLNRIAAEARRSLTVPPELVRGLTAPPVRGRYGVEQAMRLALGPSGLRLIVGPQGDLTVAPALPAVAPAARANPPAATLPPVDVVGTANAYQAPAAASPKFTAELRDTPRTVNVIPKAVIEDTASTSLQDVMRTMSGITFAAGEGGVPIADRPVIRGFNSTSNMLVDGMRDIGAQTREVFNLEQVEVTKGPDSVYFGRGGGGGSINIVTKAPRLENFAVGELSAGTAPSGRATVDGNWQLSDHAAFRLNAMGDKGKVAGRDDAVDYQKWGLAPSLALGLGTPTRVTLSYYHLQDDGMPDYSVPLDPRTGAPYEGVDRHAFYGLSGRDFRHTRTDIGTASIEHDLGDSLTLRNMTRYGQSTNSYVATAPNGASPLYAGINMPGTLQGTVFRQAKSQWTRTQTLANQTDLFGELETGSVKHRFDAGFEIGREKWNVDGWTVASANAAAAVQTGAVPQCQGYPSLFDSYDCTSLYSPDPGDPWTGSVTRNNNPTYYQTNTKAAYVFDAITLTEHWLVNAGLRWDSYRTESIRQGAVQASQKDNFVNYQLGLVYKPRREASLYVSTASASTPAALGNSDYDKVSAANRNLDPERSVTYEVGGKWDALDEKLSLTAAAFATDRKNASVQVEPGVVEPVGRTRVRGFELGASGSLTPEWQVFAGYTYLDSKIARGAYNDANVGQPLPDTPKNSLSLWSTYRFLPGWTVGGGAFFVDKRFGTACDRDCYAPSYWRFDAMLGWRVNPRLEFRMNLQNLFDKVYYTKVHYFMGDLGPGRAAVLTAVVRY